MSVVNGTRLLAASPIKDMLHGKERHGGVTFGLAEFGYDVRIKQALHFTRDKYGNKITMVTTDGVSQRQIGWAVLVNVMEEFTMPPDLVGSTTGAIPTNGKTTAHSTSRLWFLTKGMT